MMGQAPSCTHWCNDEEELGKLVKQVQILFLMTTWMYLVTQLFTLHLWL